MSDFMIRCFTQTIVLLFFFVHFREKIFFLRGKIDAKNERFSIYRNSAYTGVYTAEMKNMHEVEKE